MSMRAAGGHGWAAGAVLGLLTVSVFYLLQNYGPESAVRRFHELARDHKWAEIMAISNDPPNSPAPIGLAREITPFVTSADVYRVIHADRRPDFVILEVAYGRKGRVIGVVPWIVEKIGSSVWRVSASKTIEAARLYWMGALGQ